jgi:chromosome segregation ATPase
MSKEELKQAIKQLKQQRENFQGNPGMQNEITGRINEIEEQLVQMQAEEEQQQRELVEQNHESRLQESQSRIAQELDNLDFGGMTLRQMFSGEDEYQVVRIKFQRMLEDRDDAWSKNIKGYEEREIQLKAQNKYLQEVVVATEAENAQLHNNVIRLTNDNIRLAEEKEDSDTKRDAAVREAESYRGEIEQLKSWNDDLRNQVALGVGGAIRIMDEAELERQKAEELERLERIKAQKTVYDLVPDNDINPKNYTAKRATDGEEVTINWTQLKSYIVLTDEEQVQQFRLQHQTQVLPDISMADITPAAVDQVESQFQTETGSELVVPTSGVEETVSRQEFEALKADVEVLKRRQGMVA